MCTAEGLGNLQSQVGAPSASRPLSPSQGRACHHPHSPRVPHRTLRKAWAVTTRRKCRPASGPRFRRRSPNDMLIPCKCFLHTPARPLSNPTASVCRDRSATFQINAVSAPARVAEIHPKLEVPCHKPIVSQRKKKGNWVHYGGSLPVVLEALERFEDVGEALGPWKDTLSNRERTIILKEQKDWRRAVEIFDWFRRERGHEVNVIHYNVVLCTVGRARRWNLVLMLWHEMHSSGVDPDNSTYGTLIDACCKGGKERAAFLWLGDMCKRGLIPDEVTMSIVLQAYKKTGEYEKAECFFERWSLEYDRKTEGHPRYSLYTYNTLIDTYGKSGQLEKVSDTFHQMLREGVAPSVVTFNTMIHVWGKHRRMERVASLVSMMEEYQCFPDTRTYNILISLYRENNDIDVAEYYFQKMKAENLVPDVVGCRTLLYGYSIRGMVTKAEALLKEMGEWGFSIDEYTQSALTRMYVNAGLLEKAWHWFETFHYQMNSECFSANIDAFGNEKYIVLAEKAFMCCVKRKMLSVSVCNVMIKAYGLVEKLDEACEIADGMEMYGVLPDYLTYSSLIQLLSTAKLPEKALCYLRKMQTAKLLSDCIPYTVVISSFAKHGDLSMVECLFSEMTASGIRADAFVYSIIIDAYAEVGNVHKAAAYFGFMKKDGLCENATICNSLIKLYTKVGYLAEAREAYKLLRTLNTDANLYASNCMIDLYSDHCMVKEAREVFENLKARGSANEFSRAMMLCLYKKVGRFDEAHRICKEMQCSGLLTQALSYNSAIQMYVSGGRMKEAFKIFKKMLASNTLPNDATFKALKVMLVKGGATKAEIKKLELLRRNNTHDCLYQWYMAVSSAVRSSASSFQHEKVQESKQLQRRFQMVEYLEGMDPASFWEVSVVTYSQFYITSVEILWGSPGAIPPTSSTPSKRQELNMPAFRNKMMSGAMEVEATLARRFFFISDSQKTDEFMEIISICRDTAPWMGTSRLKSSRSTVMQAEKNWIVIGCQLSMALAPCSSACPYRVLIMAWPLHLAVLFPVGCYYSSDVLLKVPLLASRKIDVFSELWLA
ncbi:hypothetical protein EJB05_07929 [Eragrostis curvula]|uniref:PROP1-like PPR domain-containing protein n=1 Tax=Eragrostis curvula TaxID=38414 RepID=A0A5J9WK84_9POAL|nr:hypothetical protein EJB05_07929 [Eragrostis curvula]